MALPDAVVLGPGDHVLYTGSIISTWYVLAFVAFHQFCYDDWWPHWPRFTCPPSAYSVIPFRFVKTWHCLGICDQVVVRGISTKTLYFYIRHVTWICCKCIDVMIVGVAVENIFTFIMINWMLEKYVVHHNSIRCPYSYYASCYVNGLFFLFYISLYIQVFPLCWRFMHNDREQQTFQRSLHWLGR